MKKLLLVLCLASFVLFPGCATFQNQDPVVTAKKAGRVAVMLWTVEKDKFTPEQRQAVVTVWTVFHAAINSSSDATAFNELVGKKIDELNIKPEEKLLAKQFFAFAWDELNSEVSIPADAQKAVAILKAFDEGVSSGLSVLK